MPERSEKSGAGRARRWESFFHVEINLFLQWRRNKFFYTGVDASARRRVGRRFRDASADASRKKFIFLQGRRRVDATTFRSSPSRTR